MITGLVAVGKVVRSNNHTVLGLPSLGRTGYKREIQHRVWASVFSEVVAPLGIDQGFRRDPHPDVVP